jgi:signal transduction histidine kinase
VIVGFASLDPIADVTEEYIGSTNDVFIVDDKGYVASHVNKAYLGSLFSEDPIVHEIVSTKKTAASGRFEDLESRAVLGHFEKIDRTNLYAVITTPLKSVSDFISLFNRTVLTIGGLGCVLGLLALWLFGRAPAPLEASAPWFRDAEDAPNAVIQPPGQAVAQLPAQPPSEAMPPLPTAISKGGERPRDSVTGGRAQPDGLSVGFAEAVKEPVLAILGHAQLAKAKSNVPEVKSHCESIEREARRAADIIAKLSSVSSAAESLQSTESLSLFEIVDKVIDGKMTALKEDGIAVKRDLHNVPQLRGSGEQIKLAIENFIENAREAMRKRPTKTLRVELNFDGKSICLNVSDTGVGMSRDVKARAFEPFFKGFESPGHSGMGLAFAQIAIRKLGGSCEIQSSPGEGAKFLLTFPVSELEKRDFENQAKAQPVDAKSDLSQTGYETEVAGDLNGDYVEQQSVSRTRELQAPSEEELAQQPETTLDLDLTGTLSRFNFNLLDEKEAFAAVSLNKIDDVAAPKNAKKSIAEELQVKIRRPRTRS